MTLGLLLAGASSPAAAGFDLGPFDRSTAVPAAATGSLLTLATWLAAPVLLLLAGSAVWSLRRRLLRRTAELEAALREGRRSAEALRASEERLQAFLEADTTERKDAEAALRLTQYTVDHVSESAFWADRDGRIFYVNQTALRSLGFRREEIIGSKIYRLEPRGSSVGWQKLWRRLRWKRALGFETEHRRKTGETIPVEVSASFVTFEGDESIHMSVRDISERKRAEAQLLQTQKLESLGVLAGGIAHDFNNLLLGILGNVGLALLELPKGAPARARLRDVEMAGRRAAELCRQMLAYSGRGHFNIQPLDLARLVRDMAHLLEVSISKKASLDFDFADDLPAIEADVTQIRQLVMNLITNASESLGEDSGVITIRTGLVDCDRSYLQSTYLPQKLPTGSYVHLDVIDTGCGMDLETQERMFDPFFSTKFAGRGLGLAATLGIVRGHRGALEVTSEPGHGTTFRILFPAAGSPGAVSSPAREESGASLALRGEGTVLVVDDEQTVLSVARRVLERVGYRVLSAPDGQRGCDLFRRHRQEISVVLLDLSMPKLGGKEALERIRRLDGGVPVILSSGYDEAEVATELADEGVAAFLQKPYRPAKLLRTVLGVAGSRRPSRQGLRASGPG